MILLLSISTICFALAFVIATALWREAGRRYRKTSNELDGARRVIAALRVERDGLEDILDRRDGICRKIRPDEWPETLEEKGA